MPILLILKLSLVAALIGVCGYFVWDYTSTKNNLAQAQIVIDGLSERLATQNEAIKSMKTESDAKLELGRIALLEAQANSKQRSSKANVIYGMTPKGGDCASAISLGNTP